MSDAHNRLEQGCKQLDKYLGLYKQLLDLHAHDHEVAHEAHVLPMFQDCLHFLSKEIESLQEDLATIRAKAMHMG
jgi:hypothetical protein